MNPLSPFFGQIMMFSGNFAPRGWAFCNGQLLDIPTHQTLFSILGTTYGGDGRTTFGLPDLRGRMPISSGDGPGLPGYREGAKGGVSTNILFEGQLPSHTHSLAGGTVTIPVSEVDADQGEAAGRYLANGTFYHNAGDGAYGPGAIPLSGSTAPDLAGGGKQPVNNIPPYQVVNFIIALYGDYPSRS